MSYYRDIGEVGVELADIAVGFLDNFYKTCPEHSYAITVHNSNTNRAITKVDASGDTVTHILEGLITYDDSRFIASLTSAIQDDRKLLVELIFSLSATLKASYDNEK